MPRRIGSMLLPVALALVGAMLPASVRAQGVGSMQAPPMGAPTGAFTNTQAQNPDSPLGITDSFVGFIDGAVPRNTVGIRFEGLYDNPQPMRAEYIFGKGGLPGTNGFASPETKVDTLELTSFAEYSFTPWLSAFIEAPYRWISPAVNPYQTGPGDMRYGIKLCTWSSDSLIATILLRIYEPTASNGVLGTGHWSLEPGLLAAYNITPSFHLEGEIRYWTAIGGSDFAGDLLRYGIGLSYGQRKPGFWFAPVGEVIGWSILSGKTMLASSADSYVIQNAAGQFIANAYLGMRCGFGQNIDLFLGYGRAVTGEYWNRDTYRFEFRFTF
jgi:hypothetical protein